ncbi:MAG TPA: hypothetical protein VGM93_05915, partial [Acidimicrobiales bacterium]
ERHARLIHHLAAEVRRRKNDPPTSRPPPRILLVVDGLTALRAAWGETDPDGLFDRLVHLAAEGPAVGVHLALSADRPGAVPAAILGATRQRLALRLGDRADHGALGIAPSAVPDLPPGRGLLAEAAVVVQVARAHPDLARAVVGVADQSEGPPPHRRPATFGVLPDDLSTTSVAAAARPVVRAGLWRIPLGLADEDLAPAHLLLHPGEHALIAGPGRSGRTTALCSIAQAVGGHPAGVLVVAVADGRSPLRSAAGVVLAFPPHEVASRIDRLRRHPGPVVVLVDDAERLDDAPMADLVTDAGPDLHVVAAGRADALRHAFGHWTQHVRAARTGVLLQPDLDLDGDLLGCRLPRRMPRGPAPGRGWLVTNGSAELIQVARPPAG